MNARNQVFVVLIALMVVFSGGAMVTAASGSGTVDSGDDASDDEFDSANETTEEEQADEDTEVTTDDGNETVVDDEDEADLNESDEAEVDGQQSAYVTFEDQTTEGETVVVENVTLASPGFVTIHDSSLLVGDVFESVIGTSTYLEAGTHEQVEVTLDEPLEEDETLIAMPHRDTNDNQEYDFVETNGSADGPYLTPDDEPVTDDAVVSVGAADEEPVAEEPTEDNETEDVEEEPVTEEPVEDNETEDVEEEPVEEEPVEDNETEDIEEEPVEDEPVDDEPREADGITINVVIEQLNVIFVGEDDNGMDGVTDVESGDEQPDDGATDDETSTDDGAIDNESTADAAGMFGHGDMSFDQVTITVDVENIEVHSASEMPSQGDAVGDDLDTNGTETETETDDTDTEGDLDTDDTEDGVDETSDDAPAAEDGDHEQGQQIQVTIEEATVYIVVEDMEEEPAEEEEPIEEEPTEDNETEDEEDELEPIEGPTEDNETDVEEDNETEDIEEDNETEDEEDELEPIEGPTEDNETDVEEDNETDGVEEEDDEQVDSESFDVSNLDAPTSAEVGETITVTATITNPNDEERTESVQFRLNGDLVTEQDVTLEGDESQDIEFEVDTSVISAGDYIHMILTDEAGEVAALELTEATDDTETEDDGLENETDDTDDNETDDGLENETDEDAALVEA